MDFELLKSLVFDLAAGKSGQQPLFDFKTENRNGTVSVDPCDFSIIEGSASLYFYVKYLLTLDKIPDNYKIFIEGERSQILDWRIERNMRERGYGDEDKIKSADEEIKKRK